MTALRQEALQMVNDMPENLLAALIETIQNFKISNETPVQSEPETEIEVEDDDPITEEEFQAFLHSNGGINPKKAAAFERLEELRKNNTVHLPANTDWKKEFEEAICESEKYKKYFVAD